MSAYFIDAFVLEDVIPVGVKAATAWGVGFGVGGRCSLRFVQMSKIQGGSWLEGLLQHNAMSRWEVCGERMLGRKWRCSGAWVLNS